MEEAMGELNDWIYIGQGTFEGPAECFYGLGNAMGRLAGLPPNGSLEYTEHEEFGDWGFIAPQHDIIEILTCHFGGEGWFDQNYAMPLAWRIMQLRELPEARKVDHRMGWCPGDFRRIAKRFAYGMTHSAQALMNAHIHNLDRESPDDVVLDQVLRAIGPKHRMTSYPRTEFIEGVEGAICDELERNYRAEEQARDAMRERGGIIMPSLKPIIQRALEEHEPQGCKHARWRIGPAVRRTLLELPRDEAQNYRRLFNAEQDTEATERLGIPAEWGE